MIQKSILVLALVFTFVLGAFAIDSNEAQAHEIDRATISDVLDIDIGAFDTVWEHDASDQEEAGQSTAKTKWASASQCQTACTNAGCSSYQYISNGHGGGSCTCSGCSY